MLYNALGFAVNDLAEIEVEFAKAPKGIAVYNAEGKKVASQYLGYQDGKAHILLEASVRLLDMRFMMYVLREPECRP